jgi:hypothetical protein
MSVNPKTAATIAMMKKTAAHLSIKIEFHNKERK